MTGLAGIRRRWFGISPEEATFARRGFAAVEPAAQTHLERAGRAFIEGYNTALAKPQAAELSTELNRVEGTFRGFAFEGAAMALALLDLVTPWNRRRFDNFCECPDGDRHYYLLFVGAGWAVARVPWACRRFERSLRRYHPLYRWLALDGYGFHEGFFHTERYVGERRTPRRLSIQARRVFDQGLGRSMWFSHGGNADRLAATVESFPVARRADLWSGIGLGAAYAGGVVPQELEQLIDHAGHYANHLAQGASFAAKARVRAGNPAPHTELACQVFCRSSADEAATVTDQCLVNLPANGTEPQYEVWRTRIRERFVTATATEPNTAPARIREPAHR